MVEKPVNKLLIDVEGSWKPLLRRVRALRSTIDAEYGGEYYFPHATGYHSILVDTMLTVTELEDWLYKANLSYVGVCSRV